MKGLDISHHQNDAGKIDWGKVTGYEFVFVKCTQGTTYVDPKYRENRNAIRSKGLLFGAYHFADGTDAVAEADHFIRNVGELQEGEIVVLDYETKVLKDPASWCLEWLQQVERRVGFKPMLYTYDSFLKTYNWSLVSNNNNGLWAARYGMQTQFPNPLFKPSTGSWPFYAIWQYCSKGKVPGFTGNVDLNTTEMDISTLRKYGKPKMNVPTPPATTKPLTYWDTLKRGYTFGVKTFYSSFHLGLDIICPVGSILYAWDDLEVVQTMKGVQGGNTIWAKCDGKLIRFMHLSKMSPKGKYHEGDAIGATGNTGLTTGPHLHVDISTNGTLDLNNRANFEDPEKYFA